MKDYPESSADDTENRDDAVAVPVPVAAVWDVAVAVLDDAALDDYSSVARREDGVEEDHTDRVVDEGNVAVERDDTPEEEGVGEDQNDADGRCYYYYYYLCSQYYPSWVSSSWILWLFSQYYSPSLLLWMMLMGIVDTSVAVRECVVVASRDADADDVPVDSEDMLASSLLVLLAIAIVMVLLAVVEDAVDVEDDVEDDVDVNVDVEVEELTISSVLLAAAAAAASMVEWQDAADTKAVGVVVRRLVRVLYSAVVAVVVHYEDYPVDDVVRRDCYVRPVGVGAAAAAGHYDAPRAVAILLVPAVVVVLTVVVGVGSVVISEIPERPS